MVKVIINEGNRLVAYDGKDVIDVLLMAIGDTIKERKEEIPFEDRYIAIYSKFGYYFSARGIDWFDAVRNLILAISSYEGEDRENIIKNIFSSFLSEVKVDSLLSKDVEVRSV